MATQLERRTTQGVVPPHNVEAEESVLGAVMLSADAANVALEMLRADDFYKPAHQSIWEAITSLFDGNQPIDPITVADWLRRTETLDRVGGIGAITRLMEGVPSTSNVDYYAGIVDETSARRRLLRAGGEVGSLALQGDIPIDEVLDSAEAEVFAVAERKLGEGLEPVGPLLKAALEKIESLGESGGDITGTATGFSDLDHILAGLHPANLIVVAARPGMGKSTLAINIAANIADQKLPVALFTLEMSREEIVHRLLASLAGVDAAKIKTGNLDVERWRKLSQATSKLYEMPFYVDDSHDLTVTAIRAKCRRLKRRVGLSLVVVDYLQLMQGPRAAENRQQEIADISRSMKNLARELQVPVIAVSQLNRQLESRENKRPRLGDLRESGAIEQDADVVLFIYRDDYYDAGNPETMGIAEVEIAKHRAGARGTIKLGFAAEFNRFNNLAKRQDPM
ncbi:MAG: replicative DNA helicase [Actinobacteria bacterium RBG_16_68_21]|nr:MAG: replicative DNA helicase [Actinobacteria bacterium RBG_16_68_21]